MGGDAEEASAALHARASVSETHTAERLQHLGDDSSGSCSESDDDEDVEDAARQAASTILIFDWDDTVLPSSWIQDQGLNLDDPVSDELSEALQIHAEHVLQTLALAKLHGRVVLVTNAEHGWIEVSCQKFMPSVLAALADVRIMSARSTYEAEGIDSPFHWKLLAFESEIGAFSASIAAEQRKHVISFGDSAHEREALIRVTERLPNCCMKSLKFVERPTVEQLSKEHQLLTTMFSHIAHYHRNLDLCIRCS